MKANYHTHTWRCKHATGTEREYVEDAIAGGISILGFSDHTPMPYPKEWNHVSWVKMGLDELEGYVDTVLALKKEYEKEIEIHVGLEVEYYPDLFQALLDFTSQYPLEYFLLAQHFLGNERGEAYSGEATDDPVKLERYVRQCLEALETGRFTYLAHPDLLNFTGDKATYRKWYRFLCEGVKELGYPLEINLLGIWTHRHYPNHAFWEIAGQVGNKVVLGSDAHQRDKVSNPKAEAVALQMVDKYGLELLETVPLINPFGRG